MCNLRAAVIFFAGAEFFHTISHILLPLFITLPIDMKVIQFTDTLNIWAIAINAICLLLWAHKLKK